LQSLKTTPHTSSLLAARRQTNPQKATADLYFLNASSKPPTPLKGSRLVLPQADSTGQINIDQSTPLLSGSLQKQRVRLPLHTSESNYYDQQQVVSLPAASSQRNAG
jgi:hypothetical protein